MKKRKPFLLPRVLKWKFDEPFRLEHSSTNKKSEPFDFNTKPASKKSELFLKNVAKVLRPLELFLHFLETARLPTHPTLPTGQRCRPQAEYLARFSAPIP